MGFYDTLRCHFPLPVAGANEQEFQTKSTPAQLCDAYEIRTDGTLWHQAYEMEDRSDPHAKGLGRFAGMATRVNQRWVPEPMSGELRFYTFRGADIFEFVGEMMSGRLVALTTVTPPGPRQVVAPPAPTSEEPSVAERDALGDRTVYGVVGVQSRLLHYARVEQLLGEKSLHIANPIDLHDRIVAGLPRRTLVQLVEGLTCLQANEVLKALNVRPGAWHRIVAEQTGPVLDPECSARVWSLAETLVQAEEVLGGREDAERWMAAPAIGLNARRPIDLMATPQGTELVKTLLLRMANGVYA